MRKNMFLLVAVMVVLISFALVTHAHVGKPLAEGENFFTDTTGNYEKQFEALKDDETLAFDTEDDAERFENWVNVYLSDNNIKTVVSYSFASGKYLLKADPEEENVYEDAGTREEISRITKAVAEADQLKGLQPGTDEYIRQATELTVLKVTETLEYDDDALDENKRVKQGYDNSLAKAMKKRMETNKFDMKKEYRRGVCVQYSKLACRVLRELGIEAEFIGGKFTPIKDKGKAELQLPHAWIRVKTTDENGIDGWYYSDPTNYDAPTKDSIAYLIINEDDYKAHYRME